MSESVAETLTLKAVISLIVVSGGRMSEGATLISLMTSWNVLVAVKLGVPLSLAQILTVLVLGPWSSAGVHEMAPAEEMLSPGGPAARNQVRVWAGVS